MNLPTGAVKLLFYSHFFAPSVGGVESIMLTLAEGLAALCEANGERAFEIILVTQTAAGKYDDSKLSYRIVRQPGASELWKLIRAVDVVHVAGPALVPIIFGRLVGKPVVVEHHGFQTICPNGQLLIEPAGTPCPGHFMAGRHSECFRCNGSLGWMGSRKLWLLTFVRRFLCKSVAANITPTRWLGNLLGLPNNTNIFHGLVGIEEKGLNSAVLAERPTITFMGRLVTTKGVRLLLEAARILRERKRIFQVVIIGDGPERAALQQFSTEAQLDEQVVFAGRLSGPKLEMALRQSLAVVVPSLGGEVFGLVVAENMLRSLAVVASDLGSFAEVLDGTGVLFQTGNAADLAAKLGQLLDNPEKAREFGERARQRATDVFSLRRMLESHQALYRQVLERTVR